MHGRSRRPARTATLSDLPPLVWALVLRGATLHMLHCVAHTCRALHHLVTSHERCTCASGSTPAWSNNGARARAFWAHLRNEPHVPWPHAHDWHMMVRHGHVAHVALALRCGVDPSAEYQLAIRMASEHGHVAMVNLLLCDARVDPSANGQHAIRCASKNGHVAVVERLLLDARVDPGADNQYAICYASENGHATVVGRLLRDARVDPSEDNQYAVRHASRCGHALVVQRLLLDERVARATVALGRCLSLARAGGHDDVVALLERHCAARRLGTVTK